MNDSVIAPIIEEYGNINTRPLRKAQEIRSMFGSNEDSSRS